MEATSALTLGFQCQEATLLLTGVHTEIHIKTCILKDRLLTNQISMTSVLCRAVTEECVSFKFLSYQLSSHTVSPSSLETDQNSRGY